MRSARIWSIAILLAAVAALCGFVAQSLAFGVDRPKLGPIELVSVSSSGVQANEGTGGIAVSDSGRFVVFQTKASSLDPSGRRGLFVRDRDGGVTELIAPDSLYGDPGVSGDGRFVSYLAANGAVQILDRRDGLTEEVTPSAANGAALSRSGRWVGFSSTAALVADDTNATADLYVFDRVLRRFERVSVPQAGGEADGPTYGWATQISATGRYVLFRSSATNLVNNDTNGFVDDVFLRDRWTGTTELISANVSGGSGNDYSWPKDISADGRIVVFHSFATDVVPGSAGGFFRDRWTGRTFAIKGFSPDSVDATGLIAAGRDSTGGIAILNRLTGAITRVSVPASGEPDSPFSFSGIISDNAGSVTFSSEASNLVLNDSNKVGDIFARDVCWLLCPSK